MRLEHRASAVAAALVADAFLGEPPVTVHPTVLMGRTISAFERRFLEPRATHRPRLAGLFLAISLPTLAFALARAALLLVPSRNRWMLEVALLWTTLSMRGLGDGALAVQGCLEKGDLASARTRVGEIVGRDTDGLSGREVARAAVESVAENASDGVVAPMLYGLAFGAPGALAYKAINTLDSMVGYPNPPYTEFGRASARLDDVANLVPARLTAFVAALVSGGFRHAWKIARLHGPLTRSPNAGWAEAAFAAALGVSLGGTNSYGGVVRESPTLGVGRPPGPADIRRAVALMRRVCALIALVPIATAAVTTGIRRLRPEGFSGG